MEFSIIAAVDDKNGIGRDGGIPWDASADPVVVDVVKRDRKCFADCTHGGTLIMGRATWDSLPRRPLPNRLNIVVTSGAIADFEDTYTARDLKTALEIAKSHARLPVWVIGGERIYREALLHPLARCCRVTRIPGDWGCDRFMPLLDDGWKTNDGCTYTRVNTGESAYLDVLRELTRAPLRPNRTGISANSVFTRVLRFDLVDAMGRRVLPMLTTKRVSFRIVAEELLWFIRGSWDARELQSKDVHIWDGNSTREYLDSRGLTRYRDGEVGMQYGMQWRHWGAEYVPECDRDAAFTFKGKGIDQLQAVIDGIRADPWSRRHLLNAWNVSDLPKMALQPCHVLYQFYVDPDIDGKPYWLSCHMTQRSGDWFLGKPVNVCSVAALTHMIAEVCGLRAKEIATTIVDCHLYKNHMEAANTQLARAPRGFPHFEFSQRVYDRKKSNTLTIDDWSVDDFLIHNYYPHPIIKAPMAV